MDEKIKVLALKYRPKRFENLIGQATISQTLSLALDTNRLSHAYLFSGLRGSGKTSTARIMAKALLCEQGPTSKPCEVCENCKSANENRHLDVVEMDAASNRGIDDIKDLIEHTKYKPSSARFKVFIIDEVHMLTPQAFNALLKTLEEPPGFVKFILATTDPLKLPATILSRTQHFRFKKIANKDVIHHLTHILNEEKIGFEQEALEIVSRSGQGSLRDTLTLLDQAIVFTKGNITTSGVVDMLGLIDPNFMDKIFDLILNKEDATDIINALEEYEANQICDEMTIYLKNQMLRRSVKFDTILYDRFFRIIADAKHLLTLNSDPSFVIILMLFKMSEASNLKTIDEIINEVEQIETKDIVPVPKKVVVENIKEQTPKETPKVIVEEKIDEKVEEENLSNQNEIKEEKIEVEEKINVEQQEEQRNDILSTPFDEEPLEKIDVQMPQKIEPEIKSETIQTPEPKAEEVEIKEDVQSNPFDEQPLQQTYEEVQYEQEPVIQSKPEPIQEHVQEEEKIEKILEPTNSNIVDENKSKFEHIINRVYDRDVQLGEAFEDNFSYKSFQNNELTISSSAQGDVRSFLLKHYGVIKTFIYDVFGSNIEIKFDTKVIEKKIDEVIVQPQETNVQDENSEKKGYKEELTHEKMLNSKMVNKIKELFDITKITVKSKK